MIQLAALFGPPPPKKNPPKKHKKLILGKGLPVIPKHQYY